MSDLVSIVIPNFNLGRFAHEAIDSALGQTHRDVEVVVVDDGSTDDSLARIRAHPGFSRGAFRLVAQPNAGVSVARNEGARVSRGGHLVFLDADDVLAPTYVERCLEALHAAPRGVAYAYTQMQHFGADDAVFASLPFDRRVLLRGNFVNASALVRREAFEAAGGFDPSFTLGYEDYELWVRMLSLGHVGVLVPEALLRYRRHAAPSRNTLTEEQLLALRLDIAVRHPGLLWREILRHPGHAWAARRRRRASRRLR